MVIFFKSMLIFIAQSYDPAAGLSAVPLRKKRFYHQRNPVSVLMCFLVILTNLMLSGTAVGFNAQDLPPDEFTPLELSFFADLADGVLQEFDHFDAFLIASGIVDADTFYACRQQLKSIRKQLTAGIDRNSDPYILGKTLLLRLHDQVFKEYVETASFARVLLDKGKYNCLSSSILYYLTARDLGLAVSGVLVPNHTFCVLSDPRGDKRIETTLRYGFDPGRIEVEQLKQMIRYVCVPEAVYKEEKFVAWRELLSLLYTNNLDLAGFVVRDDYEDYLPRFRKALLFDPQNKVFKDNMLVCLNNLAVLSLETGELEKAHAFILQGRALETSESTFKTFEVQYYNQSATKRADIADFRGAVQFIREGLQTYPGNPVLANNLLYFYGVWAESFVRQNNYAAVVSVYFMAREAFPEDEEIRKHLRVSFYNHAAHSCNVREYEKAISICREALRFFPEDESFRDMINTVRSMTQR